ncbi:hypothetical protein [Kitasatospora sp. NPDC057198]|uniref:hypothetical protein n=1 Tax=Kitasatospora sp. NPDC057198 TaxID=3346046 RepID=UPI003637E558
MPRRQPPPARHLLPPSGRSRPRQLGVRRRRTLRRAGFTDEVEAHIALRQFHQTLALGFVTDPRQKTTDYLHQWLDKKVLHLKPTTMTHYRDHVENDLIPAPGDTPWPT